MKFLTAFFILAFGLTAEARLFDISKETFASYFLIGGGPSSLGDSPYRDESGSDVSFDSSYHSSLNGEFGFLYSTPTASLRFGFEVIKPNDVKADASNASGTALYNIKNDLLVFVPKLGLELNLAKTSSFGRFFALFSVGYANLTMQNDYTLTAAGKAKYSGVSDHSIEAKGTATELTAGFGGEVHLNDTTTILLEATYRHLEFTSLTYSQDVATFVGSKKEGSTVQDSDGQDRKLNFSGVGLSLGLRFYL